MTWQFKQQYYQLFQQATASKVWWKDPLFLLALGLAVFIHISLIGVHFVSGSSLPMSTKDVTIAVNLTKDKVEQSDFLAQHNQQGNGILKDKNTITSPLNINALNNQQGLQQQGLEQIQQLQKQIPQFKMQHRVLVTTLSWQQYTQQYAQKEMKEELRTQLTARAAMIASIEAQYSNRQQLYSKTQKIKNAHGVTTSQDDVAAYLERFRQKVELFGNRYYPNAAKLQNLSGEVRLMVIINSRGGLRAIRMVESSGQPILDEAAKQSVRRSAPFGRFDDKLKFHTELRIVRTWRFYANASEFEIE